MSYLKNIGLSTLMFAAVAFTSCSNSQTSEASKTEQSSQNVKQDDKINFDKAFIVDVRTPQEFASGHYEGAVNIPLNQVSQQLSEFDDKEQIVVYCRSGARSGNAKQILESNGYTNVTNAINLSHLNKLKKEQE